MTDQHKKALRELIALAAKSSPMPWAIDPDNRPDMEWNNFIVQAARPHMTVCFMAHSGREDNSELEHAAEFIAKASQAIEALTALLDERDQADKKIKAAETVSRLYFEIAADALGEDAVNAAFNEKLSRELKGET